MPVIRRFKPKIVAPLTATSASEAAPVQVSAIQSDPIEPSTSSHPHSHHHHFCHPHHHQHAQSHEHIRDGIEKPASAVVVERSSLTLAVSTPPPTEAEPKRPTSISLSISPYSHAPAVFRTAKSPAPVRSPAPQARADSPLVQPQDMPTIRRTHQVSSQENLSNALFENKNEEFSRTMRPTSPAMSNVTPCSSRAGSPAPSTASTNGGFRVKRRRSLLNKPIELPPCKEEVVVENLKMRDYVLFNPDGSPMRWHKNEIQSSVVSANDIIKDVPAFVEGVKVAGSMSPPPSFPPGSMGTPRVRLGNDGEAIINEESLIIDTVGDRVNPDTVSKVGAVHEEMESSTTYTTYARYRQKGLGRGRRWTKEETARFFVALRCCGLDFSMISKFFPDRHERELRSKFKAEDKRDPDVVTRFLSGGGDDDDELGSYDPLALLATSTTSLCGPTSKRCSRNKAEGDVDFAEPEKQQKRIPKSNSKRGDGVPRGRGSKVRLTIGEDSLTSGSEPGSPIIIKPKHRKILLSESSETCGDATNTASSRTAEIPQPHHLI